jgi:hypothetical protein
MIEHALSVVLPLMAIIPLHFSGIIIAYIVIEVIKITYPRMNNIKLNNLTSVMLAVLSIVAEINPLSLDIGI